ncbi:MAG: hypothetical protein WC915_02670 [archaeon]|jgi:hypothetical protein
MEKDLLVKIIGIIVVIALAGSMLAAVLVYAPDTTTPTDNLDAINQEQTSSFDYQISFDTNVLANLNSIRVALQTTELNKQDIDLAIGKVSGVSRIASSEFRNLTEGWYYFAEIDLKKNVIIEDVVQEIKDLNYFDGLEQVMKRVSINTPGEALDVYNADNNITRKFTFEYPTTYTIAPLETMPGDVINVSGTITLQGKTILGLELIESTNNTAATQTFATEKEFEVTSIANELFFEAKFDGNVDQNYYEEQLTTIDPEMQKFFYNNSFIGQTQLENKVALQELFSDVNNLDLKINGKIFLDKTYIADLNKEFDINREVDIELLPSANVGDTVLAELTIFVQRDTITNITAVQKQ